MPFFARPRGRDASRSFISQTAAWRPSVSESAGTSLTPPSLVGAQKKYFRPHLTVATSALTAPDNLATSTSGVRTSVLRIFAGPTGRVSPPISHCVSLIRSLPIFPFDHETSASTIAPTTRPPTMSVSFPELRASDTCS